MKFQFLFVRVIFPVPIKALLALVIRVTLCFWDVAVGYVVIADGRLSLVELEASIAWRRPSW